MKEKDVHPYHSDAHPTNKDKKLNVKVKIKNPMIYRPTERKRQSTDDRGILQGKEASLGVAYIEGVPRNAKAHKNGATISICQYKYRAHDDKQVAKSSNSQAGGGRYAVADI